VGNKIAAIENNTFTRRSMNNYTVFKGK